jgi:hypothetical protein
MAPEMRTWEQVLAAVEDDAARAAALLAHDVEQALPAAATPPLLLPALADMPAIPEHLRDRIETLRECIGALQDELALALREWQFPAQPALTSVVAEPHYLDRRV